MLRRKAAPRSSSIQSAPCMRKHFARTATAAAAGTAAGHAVWTHLWIHTPPHPPCVYAPACSRHKA